MDRRIRSFGGGAAGTSLMCAVVDSSLSGIAADCGGNLSRTACHVHVDEAFSTLPPSSDEKKAMVECAVDLQPNSRLSCQITADDYIDRTVVYIPTAQCGCPTNAGSKLVSERAPWQDVVADVRRAADLASCWLRLVKTGPPAWKTCADDGGISQRRHCRRSNRHDW